MYTDVTHTRGFAVANFPQNFITIEATLSETDRQIEIAHTGVSRSLSFEDFHLLQKKRQADRRADRHSVYSNKVLFHTFLLGISTCKIMQKNYSRTYDKKLVKMWKLIISDKVIDMVWLFWWLDDGLFGFFLEYNRIEFKAYCTRNELEKKAD